MTAKNSQSNGPKLARALLDDLERLGLHPVFGELGPQQREGEAAAHHQQVRPLTQQERHGADVVFVGVGEDDGIDVAEAVADRGEVRQDQIDARAVGLREEHPAVDDQQPAGVLEDGHVATDLAEAAERDDPQAVLGQRPGCGEVGMRDGSCGQVQAGGSAIGAQDLDSAPASRQRAEGAPDRPAARGSAAQPWSMITPWVRKKPV